MQIMHIFFYNTEPIQQYIRRKYDASVLTSHRQLESKIRKWKKAELDLNFLLTCKLNNVTPHFLKFKIYKRSLYNSDFYHDAVLSLLNHEISCKEKLKIRLQNDALLLEKALLTTLTIIDSIYVRKKLNEVIKSYCEKVITVHNKKFQNLGVSLPTFNFENNVIFNVSSYSLSNREKFLLSLGLDFGLPSFKPNFVKFFLPFEKLAYSIKPLLNTETFNRFRRECSFFAYNTFTRPKENSWYPFLKQSDVEILKNLGLRKDLIITKPDKGKGVVLIDKTDYDLKMLSILSDEHKFEKVGDVNNFKLLFKIEDKINRFLLKLKNDYLLSDSIYDSLYSSGSSFGLLYGSPKVHKPAPIPLRPILAAYNLPNFNIAKYLVPLLSPLTTNQFSVKNSFEFSKTIQDINPKHFLVSFDVESLFTNVPLNETIEIILNALFIDPNLTYSGLNRSQFKTMLEFAVHENHFIFDNTLYKQTEGMAMGSPLGPTFANIFLNHLESKFLEDCPPHFRPITYHRYVDDTLTSFTSLNHAKSFLNFINNSHPNINFTMETEIDNKINFLDILITRREDRLSTNVFRKGCFTGQGLNYYSFCSDIFKVNSCKTLINRAYSICSDWFLLTSEFEILEKYFRENCYPSYIFHNCVKKFLNNIFKPTSRIPNVPKLVKYVSFPFLGHHTKRFEKDLVKIINKYCPFLDIKIIFNNPYKIGSLFNFKDALPTLMRSKVVYIFTCPKCTLGTYIGCTIRHLRTRVNNHQGISHRTLLQLKTREKSSIYDHCNSCKHSITYKDFKILSNLKNKSDLCTTESLFIKRLAPHLNRDQCSIPLYVA
jgi:hypothetical protein